MRCGIPSFPKGVRIIPSSSARERVGGPSGSWRGNGSPSLRRVGAVRAEAPRSALRQGPRSYGMHQGRNLRNGLKLDGGRGSAWGFLRLLGSVKSSLNKRWARGVAVATGIPPPRAVASFIGPKGAVAGLV